MTTPDIEALDPVAENLQLENGAWVYFVPLRTRELFRLLKIVTNGAGPALVRMDFSGSESDEAYATKLLSVVAMSVPNAEDEAIEFIQSICRPVGLIERPDRELSKGDRERNEALWISFYEALHNPDPMDTLNILEAVIKREASDMRALGKKVVTMLEMARKTGQIPASQDTNSSDRSAEPSTSSAQSTGGRTKKSSSSRSAASAKLSQTSLSNVG